LVVVVNRDSTMVVIRRVDRRFITIPRLND
jgi:hypothetical protein